jgi:hypothetical protein
VAACRATAAQGQRQLVSIMLWEFGKAGRPKKAVLCMLLNSCCSALPDMFHAMSL